MLGHYRNETEFKADLIEKFSFAIPFRENPLGNPADTLRMKSEKKRRIVSPSEHSEEKTSPVESVRKFQPITCDEDLK